MKYEEKYPACTARPCTRQCEFVHTHQLVEDRQIIRLHTVGETCSVCSGPTGWAVSAWTKIESIKFKPVCSEECYRVLLDGAEGKDG